jgi:hypothetical protein
LRIQGWTNYGPHSETFVDGVRRHFSQELNLDVEVLEDFHGIRFLCRRVGSNEPESTNHSELRWVTEEQFRNMPSADFVGNLKHEVIQLLERYRGSVQGGSRQPSPRPRRRQQ